MLPPIPTLIVLLAWSSCDDMITNNNFSSSSSSTSSRRAFLKNVQHRTTTTTTITTNIAIIAASTVLPTPQPALSREMIVDEDARNGSSSSSAEEEELYLARPMGVPPNKNGGDSAGVESGRGGDTSDGISRRRNEATRPSAPLQYLLPAARVGLYVYQTLTAAEEGQNRLRINEGGKNEDNVVLLQKLGELLSSPPAFVTASDPTVSRSDPYGVLPPIIGEIIAQQQKAQERKRQSISVGITPQLFEPLELMGERRQWNRLSNIEKKRESDSPVRLALNIYTTNLNYNPNQYVFGGTTEEKRALIRENRLPSTVEVIRSDLDARDLYRNALQTALEDARAEYLYQTKRMNAEKEEEGRMKDGKSEKETIDLTELVDVLKQAKFAIDKWFSFVPEQDVKAAMEIVSRESAI